MGNMLQNLLFLGAGLLIGYLACTFIYRKVTEAKVGSAKDTVEKMLEDAARDAEAQRKEALLEAKDEIFKMRNDAERELKSRRHELNQMEQRLLQKEDSLDKKLDSIERKESRLNAKDNELEQMREKLNNMQQEQLAELERISGLTCEQAKEKLLNDVNKEVQVDMAAMIREMEAQAKEEGETKAREIITAAIQRVAADHVAESTVSVVALPNEEMKGRIIGREGRNIRTLENLTGIDLIIDDTPEAVILSGFDPVRREIARLALGKLIVDGRIHPARIEEMVEKSKKEVEQKIRQEGEQAVLETNVHGLHPELVKLLGRLHYRTSYGQNVLKHAIEVSHLAGIMAAEIGVDVTLAKRAGLLHDIGKALDHEIEGPHVEIGADIAKKYRESAPVIHCIMAHHGDIEVESIEAALVQAADAISAARPGARRDTLESYIKRMEKLESIANDFEGVESAYAIQAGREVRIMVKPDKVSENRAEVMVREIAKRIEAELDYPGQIKIVLIRETRVTDYAK